MANGTSWESTGDHSVWPQQATFKPVTPAPKEQQDLPSPEEHINLYFGVGSGLVQTGSEGGIQRRVESKAGSVLSLGQMCAAAGTGSTDNGAFFDQLRFGFQKESNMER